MAVRSKGEDKERRIVSAATVLFTRYGFKRTSVELLASEANVAKPTIYAYFRDKDAIFSAVVAAVCSELLAAAESASRGRGTLTERLTGMLSAKFTRYWELVQASPHAQELLDSQGALGGDVIEKNDRAFLALLVSALEGADELDLDSHDLTTTSAAQLLLRVAYGASYDATSVTNHRKHIAEAVRMVVAGMCRGEAPRWKRRGG